MRQTTSTFRSCSCVHMDNTSNVIYGIIIIVIEFIAATLSNGMLFNKCDRHARTLTMQQNALTHFNRAYGWQTNMDRLKILQTDSRPTPFFRINSVGCCATINFAVHISRQKKMKAIVSDSGLRVESCFPVDAFIDKNQLRRQTLLKPLQNNSNSNSNDEDNSVFLSCNRLLCNISGEPYFVSIRLSFVQHTTEHVYLALLQIFHR